MTQFFMGVKPGVGPVVKILKYDTDDALTLANNAYDRYYFNSENQNLSYVFGNYSISYNYNTFTSDGVYNFGNYVAYVDVLTSIRTVNWIGKISGIYPSSPFPPLPEARVTLPDGRFLGGKRQLALLLDTTGYEEGEVSSYQFPACLMRVQSLFSPTGTWALFNWSAQMADNIGVSVGDWVSLATTSVAGFSGFQMNTYQTMTSTSGRTYRTIYNYWNLPADNSPMPTYTYSANLESLRINNNEFVLTRPGYSVGGSSGRNQRIIDSTVSPALCVAAGAVSSIAPGTGITVAVSIPGIVLSDTAVVDLMVKQTGQQQFVPCHVPSGYVHSSAFQVSYAISGNLIYIYNDGTDYVDVTYVVFNSSQTGPSSGGNLVMFRGNDGARDYIQIKKPGSTDPASRPDDILVDTRLPTIHILAQGFIDAASFTDDPENTFGLGKVAKQINFNSNGMIPFVKYSLVFSNYILAPMCSLYYKYTGIPTWGPPSNQSSLCRLQSNNAKFWINPGNWSRMTGGAGTGSVTLQYDGPNPIGIRYYILGIPT